MCSATSGSTRSSVAADPSKVAPSESCVSEVRWPMTGSLMPSLRWASDTLMPIFQPTRWAPASKARRHSVSCLTRASTIRGSESATGAYATAVARASQTVLITGCSTGIGRATAEHLAAQGHTVYATARKREAVDDLAGCKPLPLDVTDESSMTAAVGAVQEAEGRIDALVNNAGYSQNGAVESIPLDSVRAQFETNVFGLIRMSQLVLPGMRERGGGRIVNIGSMGGRFTFPGGGIYHATKHA